MSLILSPLGRKYFDAVAYDGNIKEPRISVIYLFAI